MQTLGYSAIGMALFSMAALVSTSASATPITVANFSFETPDKGTSGFQGCPISGWTCNPNNSSVGVYAPVNPTQYEKGLDGLPGLIIVPDGKQAGYIAAANGSLSQDTTALIANATTYTLSAYIGRRKDDGFNAAISGSINLTHNGVVFATLNMTSPAQQGFWLDHTLTFTTTSANSAFFGQTLGIQFIDFTASQLNIDNVRLSYAAVAQQSVPEPATLTLFGLGAVALGAMRRRRRVS